MSDERTGLLVMAHGTPATPAEVADFYTRIRRGRPPSADQLAELQDRYRRIGGTSPLAQRTAAQVAALRTELERRRPGGYEVCFGAKHTSPFIEDAAVALRRAPSVHAVVGLVLTPHASTMGSGTYLERAAEALGDAVELVAVERWYDAPGFAELVARRLVAAHGALAAGRGPVMTLFTAHSLPERTRAAGDPYADEVAASAAAVADQLAGSAPLDAWQVAWQSAGRTPEPWIGPDVSEVIAGLPDRGFTGVVVCPIGFVADHLEVLFDVDVVAADAAAAVGLRFGRTASLNADPALIGLLADRVGAAVPVPR